MNKIKQKGVALIVAMLIVAIATIVATQIFYQQQIAIRQTFNQLQAEQLYQLFLSTENWTKVTLKDDLTNNKFDSSHDNWATPILPFDAEGAVIKATIIDYQACFNINNLAVKNPEPEENEEANQTGEAEKTDEEKSALKSKLSIDKVPTNPQAEILKRLMTKLNLNPDLVNTLIDWIDKDDEIISSTGAELETYSRLTPSYRAANFRIMELDELYAVSGWKQDVIETLKPYICALPPAPSLTPAGRFFPTADKISTINVNTADEQLLHSLSPEMADAILTGVLEKRKEKEKGFEFVNDFIAQLNKDNPRTPPLGTTFKLDLLSTESHYFLLEYNGKIDQLEQNYRSLIYRGGSGNAAANTSADKDKPENKESEPTADEQNNTPQSKTPPITTANQNAAEISTLYRLQYY